MAIQFPANPAVDESFTDPTSGETWIWDGTKWNLLGGGDVDVLWEQNGDDIFYNNGNVGIGTAAPSANLEVNAGAGDNAVVRVIADQTGTAAIQFGDSDDAFIGQIRYENSDDSMTFVVSGNNSATIDSAGRLLVGTTSMSANSTAVFQGRSENAAVNADVFFQRGQTNPAINTSLGRLIFADAASSQGATILSSTDGAWASDDFPGRLQFLTTPSGSAAPVERMRIRNNGKVFIGNFAGAAYNDGNIFDKDLASCIGAVFGSNGNAGTGIAGAPAQFASTGTVVQVNCMGEAEGTAMEFWLQGTNEVGSITVTTGATSYNTSSDYRLKENVVPLTGAAARVQQLKPSKFNFIADPKKTVDGFLAHEAQAVVPEAVHGTKDEVDADGNPAYQGIDQSKLVPLLTAALQEALERIETLEARLAKLEGGGTARVTRKRKDA